MPSLSVELLASSVTDVPATAVVGTLRLAVGDSVSVSSVTLTVAVAESVLFALSTTVTVGLTSPVLLYRAVAVADVVRWSTVPSPSTSHRYWTISSLSVELLASSETVVPAIVCAGAFSVAVGGSVSVSAVTLTVAFAESVLFASSTTVTVAVYTLAFAYEWVAVAKVVSLSTVPSPS